MDKLYSNWSQCVAVCRHFFIHMSNVFCNYVLYMFVNTRKLLLSILNDWATAMRLSQLIAVYKIQWLQESGTAQVSQDEEKLVTHKSSYDKRITKKD